MQNHDSRHFLNSSEHSPRIHGGYGECSPYMTHGGSENSCIGWVILVIGIIVIVVLFSYPSMSSFSSGGKWAEMGCYNSSNVLKNGGKVVSLDQCKTIAEANNSKVLGLQNWQQLSGDCMYGESGTTFQQAQSAGPAHTCSINTSLQNVGQRGSNFLYKMV